MTQTIEQLQAKVAELEAAHAAAVLQAKQLIKQAAWNKSIKDSVDRLLEMAGYHVESSSRHQLGLMNFDAIAQPPKQNEPVDGRSEFAYTDRLEQFSKFVRLDLELEINDLKDQLAKAEQRVAEACALQVATETKFHWLDAARVAKEIRSGEYRKFMKGK